MRNNEIIIIIIIIIIISYGYYPEPLKSVLVVDVEFHSKAEEIFHGTGIKVVSSHRLLGGVIGDLDGKNNFIDSQVKKWKEELLLLSNIASTQPQAAYTAFTKSIQTEWAYVQRVVFDCQSRFADLEKVIFDRLLPTLIGSEVSQSERALFSLPTRWGGLGIRNPMGTGDEEFMVSRMATSEIVDSVKFGRAFEIDAHAERVKLTKENAYKDRENRYNDGFENVIVEFDQVHQRAIMRSKSEKISRWLTAIPSIKNQFDLSAREFRDALAIRYRRPLLDIPEFCDGCGHLFSLSHALSCRKGGLIIQRHR